MEASISSLKLWGSILEARPTAMPSTPCASNRGNFMGRVSGSWLRPSYESIHSVVLGLNATSSASFERRASM